MADKKSNSKFSNSDDLRHVHPDDEAFKKLKKRKPKIRTLEDLRPLIKEGKYRIGPHAHNHALSEGFNESDMVGSILYGKELMRYVLDERILVLGQISPSPTVKIPLHVVLEYSKPRWVDIVTAFVPKRPHRPVSRGRLAEMLRYDKHEPELKIMGK